MRHFTLLLASTGSASSLRVKNPLTELVEVSFDDGKQSSCLFNLNS